MSKTESPNAISDAGGDLAPAEPFAVAADFFSRLSREEFGHEGLRSALGAAARAFGLVSLMVSVHGSEEVRGGQLGWAIEEFPPDGVEPQRITLRERGVPIGEVEACPDWERGPLSGQEVRALSMIGERLALQLRLESTADALRAGALEVGAIQTVSREMTWGSNIEALMEVVVREAVRITGGDGGGLYLLKRRAGTLELKASVGELSRAARARIPLGSGMAGWAAQSGIPLRSSGQETSDREEVQSEARRSQLAVPLVSDGRVTGVLSLEGSGVDRFTPTHERILSIFAAQAAKAIEVARLILALRKERDLRESIVGGTPNGVVALDRDRRVVLMNQSARRLLGAEEPPEGNPVDRYLPQHAFGEALARVLEDGGKLETLELAHGEGESGRVFLASLFPMGEGEERGASFILQDLTERRQLDERVQRMDRMASIGQLAAGIAHEIRNPLTGMGITLDILRDEGLSEEANEAVGDISREIDRLEDLIRGILDFARPQPAQRRPLRLAKAMVWHRTFESQCRKKGVSFRLEKGENPKVEGDPEKLMQLFLNLALNGLEATEKGGEVSITVTRDSDASPPCARVVVADSGKGMDETTASQVFNPFFTTKNEGTGLGLSIAYSIVEQHEGRIDVESRVGQGSRFTVELPLYQDGGNQQSKQPKDG